ncbi:MAG: 3D domain-containing protein [Acutalibacteraceae bacterium]
MPKNNEKTISKKIVAVVVMAAIFCASLFTVSANSQQVKISDGSTEETLTTTAINTDYILDKANLSLDEEDKVERQEEDGVIAITIHRAFDVTLNENGSKKVLSYTSGTVDDVLKDNGIEIKEGDSLNYLRTEPLFEGMEIKVNSFVDAKVTYAGKTKKYTVPKNSKVKDLLVSAGVAKDGNISASVSLEETVKQGMKVTASSHKVTKETKVTETKYKTKKIYSNKLTKGKVKIKRYGKKGEKQITTKRTYVDGKCVKTKVLKEKTLKKTVTCVKVIGTKEKYKTFTDYNGKKVAYKKVLNGSGTAYTAGNGARTSTGIAPYKGCVAVNPNIIPYGTKLYIVASDGYVYGYATAADTGGALMSGSALVDCYYGSYSQCINFGRRNVNVYILA